MEISHKDLKGRHVLATELLVIGCLLIIYDTYIIIDTRQQLKDNSAYRWNLLMIFTYSALLFAFCAVLYAKDPRFYEHYGFEPAVVGTEQALILLIIWRVLFY
jgi:hypothetical protein